MIDKATVSRILDAADIVEVVSDFVSLKRRGANYIGLCPFHNEKTPSFSVSKAKGICHCFSCGKGGSPVNFIMEHEQMSYYEALKYLANKYHIEVHERELTNEERAEQSERESMLIINETANKYFEDNLYNTTDGKEIGLSYFYERGFSDSTINKFHLGYSKDENDSLFTELTSKGFNQKYLFDTGLCIEGKYSKGYDRFKGRVMFPVFNVAGKIIAFGGRTLKNDKAKYVNSPESIIYKKSNELYGLYQAKASIVSHEKCYLVEGYADVISMHQSGFDNTIASSGTSLTEGQIRLIHRFTNNVTVLYDGDAAGIKASLRSIDLLLNEGLNIKVLLLPDGDDPDSFSRKHSTSEIQKYIDENETDFIQFKIKILLNGAENDPIKRSEVIQDVIKSISVIPFPITRSVYTKECSRQLDIDEQILLNEIKKNREAISKKEFEKKEKEKNSNIITDSNQVSNETNSEPITPKVGNAESIHDKLLFPHEKTLIKYILKYGMTDFCEGMDSDGNTFRLSLINYIENELRLDDIHFTNKIFAHIFNLSLSLIDNFNHDYENFLQTIEDDRKAQLEEGIKEIQKKISDISDIKRKETLLNDRINETNLKKIIQYRNYYIEKRLCSSEDDSIRSVAVELVSERHHLSKIHTKYSAIESEFDQLPTRIPEAIYNLKFALILCQIKDIQLKLPVAYNNNDKQEVESLLKRQQELYTIRVDLAKYLGDRVVNPK